MADREPTCDQAQVEVRGAVTQRWSRGTVRFEGWFGNSKLDLIVELDPECVDNYPVGAKIAGTLFVRPKGTGAQPVSMAEIRVAREMAEREGVAT